MKTKARFIQPMLLLRTEKLPQGPDWLYEIKLDGYRMLVINSEGKVPLRSRNDNDLTPRYAQIASALHRLPDETVIDGEVVALDEDGRCVLQSPARLLFLTSDGEGSLARRPGSDGAGRLVENVIIGTDKGMLSAKRLVTDKRVAIWQPERQLGLIVLQCPPVPHIKYKVPLLPPIHKDPSDEPGE